MAGERCSSQASAIWLGVAPWLWAIRTSGEFGLASLPAASGYQGIKAMPPPAGVAQGRDTTSTKLGSTVAEPFTNPPGYNSLSANIAMLKAGGKRGGFVRDRHGNPVEQTTASIEQLI